MHRQFAHPIVQFSTLFLLSMGCLSQAYAQASQQKVSGPQARYWLNAETSTGMGAMMGGGSRGGLGGIFGAMMGGGGPTKSLRLDLGAARDANPASGQHNIPAGMSMGASLPLAGPERAEFDKRERQYEREVPEVEETDGNVRMLFFWGCGAEAGAGQPVIIDMKQIQQGKMPPNMRGYAVRDRARPPGYGRDRGYADWPNVRDNTQVPSGASLVGDHQVTSNISPEIRFAVAASHDFLGGLTLSSSPNAAGGTRLSWNNLDRALGYAATAMGQRETAPKQIDMVVWTSSAQRMFGGHELMGFLPPGEVQRLIGDRAVMPAGTTECVIPKQAVDAAGGQMIMSSLNAFGPELNHIHPPRPQDQKVEWKQEYAVKLRTRSHTMAIDGMGGGSERSRPARGGAAQPAGQAPAPAEGGQTPGLPPVGNILRGIFGR